MGQTDDSVGWDFLDLIGESDEEMKIEEYFIPEVIFSDHLEDWERHKFLKIWYGK